MWRGEGRRSALTNHSVSAEMPASIADMLAIVTLAPLSEAPS
jgi:hypothetical protein